MKWRLRLAWIAVSALAAAAAVDAGRWWQAARLNRAIADGSIADRAEPLIGPALFAQAFFLARRGELDRALNLYKRVQDGGGPLARAALYNAANLHLQQAIALKKKGSDAALGALITPAELAKQSYREVLRRDPGDWDARFNLERALRVLPEQDDDTSGGTPGRSERAATTMRNATLGLP